MSTTPIPPHVRMCVVRAAQVAQYSVVRASRLGGHRHLFSRRRARHLAVHPASLIGRCPLVTLASVLVLTPWSIPGEKQSHRYKKRWTGLASVGCAADAHAKTISSLE
jgi:hypothetical protein